MYSTILHNPKSCVYQWALHSTLAQKSAKAQEYTERLDNLDIALNDKQRGRIFEMLMLQIKWHRVDGETNRDAVMALTAAQCKSILRELHQGLRYLGLSRELNNAQFEAVNVYSSERAKGKVYALYEYLMLKKGASDALPPDVPESGELPGYFGRSLERRLRSPESIGNLPSAPALSPAPAFASTESRRQSVNLTVGDAVDYVYPQGLGTECQQFLDTGISAGCWSRIEAGHLSQEAQLNDAIAQLIFLRSPDTIRNRTILSSKLARTVSELLFGQKYSSRLRGMAKQYLLKEIIQSKQIVTDYRKTLKSLMDSNDSNISGLDHREGLRLGSLVQPAGESGQPLSDPYRVTDQPATEVMLDPSIGPDTAPTESSVFHIAREFTRTLLKQKPAPVTEPGSLHPPRSLYEQEETGSDNLVPIPTETIKTVMSETAGSLAATASSAKTKLTAAAGKASVKLGAAATATKSIFSGMSRAVGNIKWPGVARSYPAATIQEEDILTSDKN